MASTFVSSWFVTSYEITSFNAVPLSVRLNYDLWKMKWSRLASVWLKRTESLKVLLLFFQLIGGGGKSWRKKLENNINVVPQQWKDLQQALEKERASTMKLQTEVNRMRQETQTAKMEGTTVGIKKNPMQRCTSKLCPNQAKFDRATVITWIP